MASGSQNMTTFNAKHIIGDSTNVDWAGALLHSGSDGKTSSMDTWIFADDYGSASSTYGILHRQSDDKIIFIGASTNRFWNDLNSGDTYIAGKLGINYNPETEGNTYQLYVNGSTASGSLFPLSTRGSNLGSSALMWNDAYIRGIATRHIDAADEAYIADGQLHIGYGSVAPTKAIYLYYSADTSSRTKFFEVNSNGAYAITRFGVNGQNTGYNLYVNGSSYFTDTITGDALSAWHMLGGRPENTTNFNTYFEAAGNLHHDNPARTDVEISYNRFFLNHSDQTNYGPAKLNLPVVDQHVISLGIDNGATYSRHIAFDIRTNALYVRARNNNTWTNWEQIVRNTGTWGISVTGNAATATAVLDAGDTSKKITIRYAGSGANATDWIPMHDSHGNLIPVSSTNLANKIRDKASGSWGISISGNAATATKATQDANGYNISSSYNKKYIQIIDLTGQNVNTWYPVTISLPYDGLNRIACVTQLNSGHKPSWSTHDSGYTAVVEILAVAHGWGTTGSPSICLCNDQRFIYDSTKPPIGYSQFGNSSRATFWCRGGAKYRLLSDFFDTWTTYTSSTTVSGQTIAPTTTYPGISFNVSTITANITGTAGGVAWGNVSSKPATATRWPSWSEVTSKPAVQNNLTSTSTTDMLSAAQGKALNDNKTAKGTGLAYTTLLSQTYAGTSLKSISVSNISSYNALFFACYYWSWWRGSILIPISEFKSHGVTVFFMIGGQTPEYANFKYVSDTSIQISTDYGHELVFKVWGVKTP